MIVHHTGTLISNCTRNKIVIAKNTAPTICIKSNIFFEVSVNAFYLLFFQISIFHNLLEYHLHLHLI